MLIDSFARHIRYLRLSVTDRCDFRCVYCMSEAMQFLPRSEVLSFDEIVIVARTFVDLGVEKIRVTGGEPLIRKDIHQCLARLAQLPGLRELTLTTNGARLSKFAPLLREAGVGRINISLDTLRDDRFVALTRVGRLTDVLAGIEAALAQGFERVKLNCVVLKNRNADEVLDLVRFALARGVDISFIEEMPLGAIDEHSRVEERVASAEIRRQLAEYYTLRPLSVSTAGPSRYWGIDGESIRIGFISPHSENFCADCNRVRLTANGRLLSCLGSDDGVDLKSILRARPFEPQALRRAIDQAVLYKPQRHRFDQEQAPQILRFMNATGG